MKRYNYTKNCLLARLPMVFDVDPPSARKVIYSRGAQTARLQWEKDGVLSIYRMYVRNRKLWIAQTICANDRVFNRTLAATHENLTAAGLTNLAAALEARDD